MSMINLFHYHQKVLRPTLMMSCSSQAEILPEQLQLTHKVYLISPTVNLSNTICDLTKLSVLPYTLCQQSTKLLLTVSVHWRCRTKAHAFS